ncbi:MAG: hypothetical protein Q9208_004366 [Pyrenodesmia sp. 3 TL-2023]
MEPSSVQVDISGTSLGGTQIGQQNVFNEHKSRLQTVTEWFSPINFAQKQKDVYKHEYSNSKDSFFEAAEFNSWKRAEIQVLWCRGIAKVGIACIYCEHQQQHAQTPQNLLASLWPHLRPNGEETLPSYVDNLYRIHTQNRTRPDLDQIQSIIQSAIKELEKAYIIIDGLDELSDAEHQETFMESIQALLGASNAEGVTLQVLVTSRLEPRVLDGTSIEIQATEEEIRSVVRRRIVPRSFSTLSIRKRIMEDEGLRNEILDQVVAKANGMFLIADLHMSSLRSMTNIRDLRDTLSKLPEKLDDYYKRAWTRIRKKDKHQAQIAYHAMAWLYLSQRQLTVDELRHALAIRSGDKIFCSEGLVEVTDIIEACQGLVVVETHSQLVRLMHSTIREFFQRHHDWLFKKSPAYLTKTCLTYLCLDVFEEKTCDYISLEDADSHARPGENIQRGKFLHFRLLEYPFLDYAAENWGYHAAGSHEERCLFAILTFLASNHALENAHMARPQVFHRSRRPRSPHNLKDLFPLRVAISFGLELSACWLVEPSLPKEKVVELMEKHILLALLEAMENGQVRVVNALLDAGIVPSRAGELPLTVLDCTFLYKDGRPKTALDKSVCYSHGDVANLLVRRGVGGPVTNDTMKYAVSAENFDILCHYLFAAPSAGGQYGRANAILHYAAKKGKVKVVEFSLANGANIESEADSYFMSSLGLAVVFGQSAVVQCLLDSGADVSVEMYDTSVSLGESDSASSLIQESVRCQTVFRERLNLVNEYTLEFSSGEIHDNAIDQLRRRLTTWLSTQPEPLELLHNPEFLAAMREDSEHEKIIRMLLQHKPNVSVLGQNGETLLHLAVISKPRMNALLQHLMDYPETGLDVNTGDCHGRTPLHYAAVACNADVMELLIKHGADVLATDHSSMTTLHFAVQSRRCIAIATKHGCRPDVAHSLVGTPLDLAESLKYPNAHAIKVVLEKHLAEFAETQSAQSGPRQVARDLLDADSKEYQTITSWMISKSHDYGVLCRRSIRICLNGSQQHGYVQELARIEAEAKGRERKWILVPDP